MITSTTYNGLPVKIVTKPFEIRKKIDEARMLAELSIFEPIMLTIEAEDGSTAFPVYDGQPSIINGEPGSIKRVTVPASSLEFKFQPTRSYDRVNIAGITARVENVQSLERLAKYPSLIEKLSHDAMLEHLRLYLISDTGIQTDGSGSWNEYEHNAQSARDFSFGE